MRPWFLSLVSLACLLAGVARSAEPQSLPLAAANQEFVNIFKNYTAFKSLKVNFSQEKHLKELKNPLKSAGSLEIDRGVNKPTDKPTDQSTGRLLWQITTPSPLSVEIADGHITLDSRAGERQVFDLKKMNAEAEKWQSLLVWMDFNPEKIIAHYKVSRQGQRSFSFEPNTGETAPFKKLVVTASAHGDLSRLEMIETSDDTVIFNFAIPTIKR